MILNPDHALTAEKILEGVNAAPISALPQIWQQIAVGEAKVGHPEPEFLVALARLFLTKATDRSPEVFQQDFDFQNFYCQGAAETLEFFGQDYLQTAYPDFDLALSTAKAAHSADKVVAFAKAAFEDFGYWLPASFYWMLLCPIERESIFESRALFFHPQSQGVKRPYDACLHGLNVTAILMRVQHHASRQGLLLQHGCGCDHNLSQIIPGQGVIDSKFESDAGKRKALVAYLWRLWNEYLLFSLGVHAEKLAL
jgi:hypothetical protein